MINGPTMIGVIHRLVELAAQGEPVAIATVVRTQGSTPQVVGAKLVVIGGGERGKAAGTLGGGCVEADAILAAREVLDRGGRTLRAYELTEDLAWNTGLVCGGTMWILAERAADALTLGGRDVLGALGHAANGGAPVAVATLLRRVGRELSFTGRLMVDAEGARTGSVGDAAHDARVAAAALAQLPHGTARLVSLDEEHDVLIEPVTGQPKLVIAGGGHVALAIARQARLLDFDVTVIEDRPEFADPSRFAGARVIAGDIAATLASLDYGWSSYIVVATRGHKLDGECVLAAARTSARYIGLLGSRRKTILIQQMLRDQGVPDDRIGAVRSPVGLDLGGRTPAEIALSVMAEITQVRYQGSGRALGQEPLRPRSSSKTP
jgi:xanthine dehydrogenase accessory factor